MALVDVRGAERSCLRLRGKRNGRKRGHRVSVAIDHVGHQADVRVRLLRHRVKRISSVAYGIGFLPLSRTNFYLNRAQQIRAEFIRRLWHADKMPLTFIAIVKAEEFELFGCLYALGNDVDGKVSRKKDY